MDKKTRNLALSRTLPPASVARPTSPAAVLDAFLATARSEHTKKARLADLAALGRWVASRTAGKAPTSPVEAAAIGAEVLLASGRGNAQAAAEAFVAEACGELSPASRNRARSTLRAFVRGAIRWGLVDRDLVLPGEPARAYRDTRGPGQDAVVGLWTRIHRGDDPRSRRDAALLALLYGLGLRAGEVLSLDLEHLDAQRKVLAVREKKGGGERRLVTLPDEVLATIGRWIEVRGDAAGPLFVGFTGGGRGRLPEVAREGGLGRMSRTALERVVRRWSAWAGAHVRAHGLRHAAVTSCLDAGHDVRAVQRFARHANIQTTAIYDDNRTDLGGKVAAAHVARLEAARKKIEAAVPRGVPARARP